MKAMVRLNTFGVVAGPLIRTLRTVAIARQNDPSPGLKIASRDVRVGRGLRGRCFDPFILLQHISETNGAGRWAVVCSTYEAESL